MISRPNYIDTREVKIYHIHYYYSYSIDIYIYLNRERKREKDRNFAFGHAELHHNGLLVRRNDFHVGAVVGAALVVVGGAEDGEHASVVAVLVAGLFAFVRANYQTEHVLFTYLIGHVRTPEATSTFFRLLFVLTKSRFHATSH